MKLVALFRFAIVACLAMFALAACGGASSSSTASTNSTGGSNQTPGCVAGVSTINGITTRNFCGPAKATATVNGQIWSFSGGVCEQDATVGWGLNIGRVILGTDSAAASLKKQYDYFGVAVTDTVKDGTMTDIIVTGEYKGQSFSLINDSVTFSNGVTQGTFTGKDIQGGDVSGSFSC
jgi:hypothetical protein